jgi:serine/threonine-protein kinase
VLVAVGGGCGPSRDQPAEAERFSLKIPTDLALESFALSPDGKWLALSAETSTDGLRRIFVGRASLDAGSVREISGTNGGTNPFFSPDGLSIAYFSRGAIWRVPTSGDSAPQRVTDAPSDSAGGAWTADGRIIFAPLGQAGLMQVPVSGGSPTSLTSLDDRERELEHGWPHTLPGGHVVFTVSQQSRDPHIEVVSPGKERTRLRVPIAGQAQFVQSGHLVYGYFGNLMAVRFDADEIKTVGVPMPVAKGLQTSASFGTLGRSGMAVSRSGTLAWLRATPEDVLTRLVRVDRNGRSTPMPAPQEVYQTPRLSPDGRSLAVAVRVGVMTREIRVLDTAQPARVVLRVQGGDNQSPAWMDNRRLSFGSNRDGPQKIYTVSVGRGGNPIPLFNVDVATARNPARWSRIPRLLALYEIDPIRRRDVLVYRVGESIAPVAATLANERSPAVSPDGRWVAYVSDVTGRDQIYVKPLSEDADASQLTHAGAAEPVWARDGLFYREGDRMMLATLERGTLKDTRVVFEGHFERDPGSNLAAYDVEPGGKSLIMLKSALAPRELRIVRNWTRELP